MSNIDYSTVKAWPFEEARKVLARIGNTTPEKGYVLFETGYGPSGLPHIGTFGEVVRTTMVRQAFQRISDIPTRLVCFSDDLDGLRKVPDNVPNKEMLDAHIGYALTSVPDPFGLFGSFAEHNNSRLRDFLDSFGFDYSFASATKYYKAGIFDKTLLKMAENYDAIQDVMLATLGKDRRETYSIFMPVTATGFVLQAPVVKVDPSGVIVYRDADGQFVEQSIFDGNVKLQWKADWASRWAALDVDYEMYGKDLIPTAELSAKIVKIIGGRKPDGFTYELFLDENGEKISKSKGNGLAVEEWLHYATPESLSYYMYQQPRRAKKLYFDVIPRAVDEYLASVYRYQNEADEKKVENPAWHIHNGDVPNIPNDGINFGMLLNLAAVANTEDVSVLWRYLGQYRPDITPVTAPHLTSLLSGAISYYTDKVKPTRKFRHATESEKIALNELSYRLKALAVDATAEQIQYEIYEVGKAHYEKTELVNWFKAIYEIVLGSETGPRMGVFIKLVGIDVGIKLIDDALTSKHVTA